VIIQLKPWGSSTPSRKRKVFLLPFMHYVIIYSFSTSVAEGELAEQGKLLIADDLHSGVMQARIDS
jgi:hypothetical protein